MRYIWWPLYVSYLASVLAYRPDFGKRGQASKVIASPVQKDATASDETVIAISPLGEVSTAVLDERNDDAVSDTRIDSAHDSQNDNSSQLGTWEGLPKVLEHLSLNGAQGFRVIEVLPSAVIQQNISTKPLPDASHAVADTTPKKQESTSRLGTDGDMASSTAAPANPTESSWEPKEDSRSRLHKNLLQDLVNRNIVALKHDLDSITDQQIYEGGIFSVQLPLVVTPSDDSLAWANGTTLVGVATRLSWFEGVKTILEWAWKHSSREFIDINVLCYPAAPSGCHNNTALHLAVELGLADIAELLLQYGASPLVANSCWETPLEMALAGTSFSMVSTLLASSTELSNGLLELQMQLFKAPHTTWPFASESDENKWRDLVPQALHPQRSQLDEVGYRPADWLLHYKCRVMCAVNQSLAWSSRASDALVAHGFDSFGRSYCLTTCVISTVTIVFFFFVFTITNLKIYGWFDVPVSLAEYIPGAFDPLRFTGADFDPSRLKTRLPYRQVRGHFNDSLIPRVLEAGTAFWQGLFGIFCSWFLQHVRIPPEKDPFDEDYLSDDDEPCRDRIRRQSVARAKMVQRLEVGCRLIVMVFLFQWLAVSAFRWDDAALLITIMVVYSLAVAGVAGMTVPQPVPEEARDDDGDFDAARLVCGLFGVQHGPVWTRCITTTRSTATPHRQQGPQARRRQRTARQGAAAKDQSDIFTDDLIKGLVCPTQPMRTSGPPVFSDQFCREFLESGRLHIYHGELFFGQLTYAMITAASMLWLLHLRYNFSGSYAFFFEERTPEQLFSTYGSPGSFYRIFAIFLEVALLFLCAERLYSLSLLVHVAALSVAQRESALEFLKRHPADEHVRDAGKSFDVRETIDRADEYIRCADFTLELSGMRWALLRGPVELVHLFVVLLYISALIIHLAEDMFPFVARLRIDPLVPLCLGNCLVWPLLLLLWNASSANKGVHLLRCSLMTSADMALASTPTEKDKNQDVEYVTLRMRSAEAFRASILRWPEGREVRCLDGIFMAFLAVGANTAMYW
mmetsp:Transcript_8364/g.18126  ORF Transcript_8364/g.18126 Transcript_8364/m.18126 type:complete len:1027 (+) Transcript_8364:110-3190(+)